MVASRLGRWLRFPSPLIKPDVRICRIRLSGGVHVRLTAGAGGLSRVERRTPSFPNTSPQEKTRGTGAGRAHLNQRDDALVSSAPLLDRCNGRFVDLIDQPAANEATSALRGAQTIGRPLGSPAFPDRLATLRARPETGKARAEAGRQ